MFPCPLNSPLNQFTYVNAGHLTGKNRALPGGGSWTARTCHQSVRKLDARGKRGEEAAKWTVFSLIQSVSDLFLVAAAGAGGCRSWGICSSDITPLQTSVGVFSTVFYFSPLRTTLLSFSVSASSLPSALFPPCSPAPSLSLPVACFIYHNKGICRATRAWLSFPFMDKSL